MCGCAWVGVGVYLCRVWVCLHMCMRVGVRVGVCVGVSVHVCLHVCVCMCASACTVQITSNLTLARAQLARVERVLASEIPCKNINIHTRISAHNRTLVHAK